VSGLPDTDGVRGVMVSPSAHVLYISHGDDSASGRGQLLAYDLVAGKVLWNRSYSFGIDSGAITPDGKTIYMPSGELDSSGVWNVLDAATGNPVGSVQGGAGAHNTIVSLDGRYVYLGGRDWNYLDVANTATNQVVQRIGPLVGGVRPFTVNGTNTLAYTTATGFLGFQVSSITTGKVLYTVPIPGFTLPGGFPLSAPSHGISLSPDEQRLFVFDAPYDYVHVFDVSGVPAGPPRLIANIKLSPIGGNESPCAYAGAREGGIQARRDGRFVYVGDSGDVIDASSLQIVATLPPLAETRKMLEIDWAGGVPISTTSRSGLGYVTGASRPPPATPSGPRRPPPGPASLRGMTQSVACHVRRASLLCDDKIRIVLPVALATAASRRRACSGVVRLTYAATLARRRHATVTRSSRLSVHCTATSTVRLPGTRGTLVTIVARFSGNRYVRARTVGARSRAR
jgi:DNA-binding beta-propeller fold protein YncE